MTENKKIAAIAERWIKPYRCDGLTRVTKQLDEKFGPMDEGKWPKYLFLADGVVYKAKALGAPGWGPSFDWLREWEPFINNDDAIELMAQMDLVTVTRQEGVWVAEGAAKQCIGDTFSMTVAGLALSILGL